MLFIRTAVAVFTALTLANPLRPEETEVCASVQCAEGTACTIVRDKGYCAPMNLTCGPSGKKQCGKGMECCNHKCGWCMPLGHACAQVECDEEPEGTQPPFDGQRPWPDVDNGWEGCRKWHCRLKRGLGGAAKSLHRRAAGHRPWPTEGNWYETCKKWHCP